MTNNVIVSLSFKREAKRLVKKYRTLQGSIDELIRKLQDNASIGESYGGNIYKVRLSDESKGRGKSGSFRVLYFNIIKTDLGTDVVLMSIYDKSEKSTILKSDALKIIKRILDEDEL